VEDSCAVCGLKSHFWRAPLFALLKGVTISKSRLILALFLILQACDGVFTYVGVSVEGLAAEGNLLLAMWMAMLGPAPALVVAKMFAACCGVILYLVGVHRILALLTALYLVAAVGPWMIRLHQF
jgi:hypothetical protein